MYSVKMRAAVQKTLVGAIEIAGVGLHSGDEVRLRLSPAPADSGLVFERIDGPAGLNRAGENGAVLNGAVDKGAVHNGGDLAATPPSAKPYDKRSRKIAAHPANVADTWLGTRLQNINGDSVATVEHLMAALAICEIDNVLVEVDGRELPILDGSAAPYVDAFLNVGICEQARPRVALAPSKPVIVEDGDRYISLEPSDARTLEVSIDFDDRLIGRQSLAIDLEDGAALRSRLAPARTFCRLRDVETMRAAGYSRGGSLDNALVVDGDRLLNENGLRDPAEFVLHKAQDLLGDLYLLGGPILGRIRAHKPGHDINTAFARKLAAELTQTVAEEFPSPKATPLSPSPIAN